MPNIRIYVQEDTVPGAIAVVDLAQELEEEWQRFVERVTEEASAGLEGVACHRRVSGFMVRVIAERIKWTAQSILSADPGCSSINDVVRAAADRARAEILAELEILAGSVAPDGRALERFIRDRRGVAPGPR